MIDNNGPTKVDKREEGYARFNLFLLYPFIRVHRVFRFQKLNVHGPSNLTLPHSLSFSSLSLGSTCHGPPHVLLSHPTKYNYITKSTDMSSQILRFTKKQNTELLPNYQLIKSFKSTKL